MPKFLVILIIAVGAAGGVYFISTRQPGSNKQYGLIAAAIVFVLAGLIAWSLAGFLPE